MKKINTEINTEWLARYQAGAPTETMEEFTWRMDVMRADWLDSGLHPDSTSPSVRRREARSHEHMMHEIERRHDNKPQKE